MCKTIKKHFGEQNASNLSGNIDDLILYLQQLRQKHTTYNQLDVEFYVDCSNDMIYELIGHRKETEEEKHSRENTEEKKITEDYERELALYQRLHKKYGKD